MIDGALNRTRRSRELARGLVLALLAAVGCGDSDTPPTTDGVTLGDTAAHASEASASALRERARAIFGTLPETADSAANPSTAEKTSLGRVLYFDPRLSKNHDVSCSSCHDLAAFGVDGEATSPGHRGQRGGRNSPTVLNAAFHVAQFWDGRAADVESRRRVRS